MDYSYQREEPLEIRGVSHFSFCNVQPFPDDVKPASYANQNSDENKKDSDFFYERATCSMTGSFRSSIYSVGWGSNEYEKDTANAVQKLFSDFENSLYGETTTKADGIHEESGNECLSWKTAFPHIRVLGKQIIPTLIENSSNYNNVNIATSSKEIMKNDNSRIDKDFRKMKLQDLCVLGHQIDIASDNYVNMESNTGEEVFASDGEIQEYLALDNWGNDSVGSLRRSRHGIPPVTPEACAQDSVISQIMNYIWNDIMIWLRDVFRILYERSLKNGKLVTTEGVRYNGPTTSLLKNCNPTLQQGRLRTGMTMSLSNNSVSTNYETLQGVMTIRSLAPRRRATTASAVAFDARLRTPLFQDRPDSSLCNNVSRKKTKTIINYVPVATNKLTSSKPPRKLTPIERVRTPGNGNFLLGSLTSNNAIRGNRITQFYHNVGGGNGNIVIRSSDFSVPNTANSNDAGSTISAFWNLKSVALPPIEKISESIDVPASGVRLTVKNSECRTNNLESDEELKKSCFSVKNSPLNSRPSSTQSSKPHVEQKSPVVNNKRMSLTHQRPNISGIIGTSMGINLLYRLEHKESDDSGDDENS